MSSPEIDIGPFSPYKNNQDALNAIWVRLGDIEGRLDNIAEEISGPDGATLDVKYGYNDDVDTAETPVDIWPIADGYTFTPVASPTDLWIASSAGGDNNDVLIEYLDASGAFQTTTVTLNGTTPVQVLGSADAIHVKRAYVDDASEASGNIAITTANNFSGAGVPNDTTEIRAYIPAGLGQTQQAVDRVPAGKIHHVQTLTITAGRSGGAIASCTVRVEARENGKSWRTRRRYSLTTGASITTDLHLDLPALSDFRIRVQDVSANDFDISAEYVYFEYDA